MTDEQKEFFKEKSFGRKLICQACGSIKFSHADEFNENCEKCESSDLMYFLTTESEHKRLISKEEQSEL